MPRVVVSGLGMLTGLGASAPETFDALLAGRSGVRAAPAGVTQWLPQALAVSVDEAFRTRLRRADNGLDRATQFALLAAREAVADAALTVPPAAAERAGIYAGIGMGGAQTLDAFYADFYERLPRCRAEGRDPTVVHPLAVPRIMANAAASALSIELGFRGPTQTFSVACSSSAVAVGEAWRAIREGRLESALVVGTEAMLVAGPYFAWNALRVMAAPRTDAPAASCRPFDRERSGFVLGEGAAALVLEDEAAARRRGARVYAEVCGVGMSSDAAHLTLPSRHGQVAAMRQALQESRLPADAVGYVNAHGTATEAGDVTECESLHEAFGPHAARLMVSSTKSMHGHLIGAAGALEFAIGVMALHRGAVPPTAHLEHQDERCTLDCVPLHARHGVPLQAVMSNSFAFGGSNVSLIACQLH